MLGGHLGFSNFNISNSQNAIIVDDATIYRKDILKWMVIEIIFQSSFYVYSTQRPEESPSFMAKFVTHVTYIVYHNGECFTELKDDFLLSTVEEQNSTIMILET